MNHAIRWFYQQYGGILPETAYRCYLCGDFHAQENYPVSKGLADTFNSHYLAASPSSPYLCAACAWYFDSKAAHPDFRKMSLMVWETGWRQWDRATMKQDIASTLQHGTDEDVYLVVSLSKKKHVLLQAPMNARGSRMLAIQVEEQVAHVDWQTWQYLDILFCDLLRLGHGKGEILSGMLYSNTLRKHGQVVEAVTASQQLEPYRNSTSLGLLSYVTIIEKEEDSGPTDSTRTGGEIAPSGLQPDRQRVQEQISGDDLGAGRVERPGVLPDHEQLSLFP